jgi:N-acetylmuramoyl-L-alanine amidase
MRIILDAGHGGNDPGAVNGKYKEKDAALSISLKIGSILASEGADVIYTRDCDRTVELGERCRIANNDDADYFISIHLNAATAKSANGIETYAYGTSGKGHELAKAVQKELITATGARDRGVKTANFYVLKRTRMPAILVETGFISNDAECLTLFKDGYQRIIAEAIAKAVKKTVGL